MYCAHRGTNDFQATVEKVLKCLSDDKKDVRKGEWTNKEVNPLISFPAPLASSFPPRTFVVCDDKEHVARINPARRGGSNAPYAFEIVFVLTTTQRLRPFLNDQNTDADIAHRSTS